MKTTCFRGGRTKTVGLLVFFLSALVTIGYISCKQEEPGINLLIKNATDRPLILHVTIERKVDKKREDFSIPLPSQKETSSPTMHRIECPIQGFDFKFQLFRSDVEAPVSSLDGSWPGSAGISDGAGSNHVLVEVNVKEGEMGPVLSFEGVL